MKLSNRLQTICDLVEENASIIDVGCDHALIDIYLVLHKQVTAIAADVNQNALAIAQENIRKYQLEQEIKTVLTDGVMGLDITNKTIIICGMGTQTIMNIIKNINQYTMKEMIIQSNHDISKLRKFLAQEGFAIIDEVYLEERGKSYIIMKVRVGHMEYQEVDYLVGPIIKKKYPEYVREYWKKRKQILSQIPEHKQDKRMQLAKIIEQIEKELL